ncbi:MAG: type IVB secretion system protein DotA [Legionella sp.]
MDKIVIAFTLVLWPLLACAADSSLTFAPPPSDYSMVFLGNIFGIVDGVLHGSGSQIMGSLFTVFNAAVLAIGGMIIMYTLLVSTMNTAHEGQMLGQKWSSIWIPIRSTIGLALLIPKASGYCLMQVFVMWVVVQGVGAADKVWDAALGYLNRGGVIIQGQSDPTASLLSAKKNGAVVGAGTILAGQVCMLGLQTQLQAQREEYLNQKQNNAGPCYGSSNATMKSFCDNPVPDFIGTVNVVDVQTSHADNQYSVDMPNFKSTIEPYATLNGVCGKLAWNPFDLGDGKQLSLSQTDQKTAQLSRAIGIQQMYLDLATVAQVMVNNDSNLSSQTSAASTSNASQQFGVPLNSSGQRCTKDDDMTCTAWGADPDNSANSVALFNGTEFLGALNDYNGIMTPSLNLKAQAADLATAKQSRQFIKDAETKGWILAGSYFFDLVNLNQQASSQSGTTLTVSNAGGKIKIFDDQNTGLDASTFEPSSLAKSFPSGSDVKCPMSSGASALLCELFAGDKNKVVPIQQLIDGSNDPKNPLSLPGRDNKTPTLPTTAQTSTVYGFVADSMLLKMPGQPGQQSLNFANVMNITLDSGIMGFELPDIEFGCGSTMWTPCIGRWIGNILYDSILRQLLNALLSLVKILAQQVLATFLQLPLQGMALIFKQGLSIIQQPGNNPVVALANMGTHYINFAGNFWMIIIGVSVTTAMIPAVGMFIYAVIALVWPILLAWLGTMFALGFITAYYVPMLPYMIFTFGVIAWLMAVIEAMVAAPIVALGITHPEGHDAFGKGEQAIMILMNVFLRPSMMIIGFIAAISLSYVGIWILNAGFDNAVGFIQGSSYYGTNAGNYYSRLGGDLGNTFNTLPKSQAAINGDYSGWAGIFAFFFSILIYTTMYVTIVQKSFGLISMLPDKVLRWIGGQPESSGEQSASWTGDSEKKISEAGDKTQQAKAATDKQLAGHATEWLNKDSGGGVAQLE